LPTGPDDATADGQRIDEHAQLGTGAFGPYAGFVYAYHLDPWNLFTSVTARLHTTNGHAYHYGDSVQFGARLDYRFIDPLAAELGVDGRWAASDMLADETQVNTGGVVVSLAPGLAANLGGDFWLRARVQIPVIQALSGTQSVGPTYFLSGQVFIH
jgi:hypothetical protein